MNLQNLVRPNIWKLKPYSSARDEFKKGEIAANVFLDANENPFPTGFNRYPDPLAKEVKKMLAPLKGVSPEQIFLGNGSDEAIDLLMRIFCEPNEDSILILPPTYGMYEVSADTNNIAIQRINLTPDFELPTAEILQLLRGTEKLPKLLFICSPNNPTANSLKKDAILEIIKNLNGIVVIDEAYIDFSKESSFISYINDFQNLVVMQTFSKAWGLAGIRLGMAFSSPEIVTLLNKVKPPYNINQLTQGVALRALQNPMRTERNIKAILKQRSFLIKNLAKLPFVQKIFSTDANFVLVKVQNANDLYHFLVEKGIIVRNRNSVTLCEGCLRITVGTAAENKQLLTGLKNFQ
jgi:histidinol-phosphate aminotransferase